MTAYTFEMNLRGTALRYNIQNDVRKTDCRNLNIVRQLRSSCLHHPASSLYHLLVLLLDDRLAALHYSTQKRNVKHQHRTYIFILSLSLHRPVIFSSSVFFASSAASPDDLPRHTAQPAAAPKTPTQAI